MVTVSVALPALVRADNLLPSIASHIQAASLLVHLDALCCCCSICTSEVAILRPIIVARGLASITLSLMSVIVDESAMVVPRLLSTSLTDRATLLSHASRFIGPPGPIHKLMPLAHPFAYLSVLLILKPLRKRHFFLILEIVTLIMMLGWRHRTRLRSRDTL